MIVYNITTQVVRALEKDWKQWLLNTHIPYLMETKSFTGYQFVKVLENDESEGITYALQLYCESIDNLDYFRRHLLPAIRQEEDLRWGNGIFSFASVMQVIN